MATSELSFLIDVMYGGVKIWQGREELVKNGEGRGKSLQWSSCCSPQNSRVFVVFVSLMNMCTRINRWYQIPLTYMLTAAYTVAASIMSKMWPLMHTFICFPSLARFLEVLGDAFYFVLRNIPVYLQRKGWIAPSGCVLLDGVSYARLQRFFLQTQMYHWMVQLNTALVERKNMPAISVCYSVEARAVVEREYRISFVVP
jgi:hypothetical protein